MKTLVNLTPHALNLYTPASIGGYDDNGEYNADLVIAPRLLVVVPSSGVARVASTPGSVELSQLRIHRGESIVDLYHFPIAQPSTWGAIEGLPEPQEGVIYVVSMPVAQRALRTDVLSPGTGPNDDCIRDDQGRIAGVTRLIAWA